MRISSIIRLLFITAPLLLASACEPSSSVAEGPAYVRKVEADSQNLRLAIHPLHNPEKLIEAYQPYVSYLNQHLDHVNIEIEASRDYQAFEKKFRDRQPELILPNPWQTLEAIKVGYRVIAMAGEASDFKGIFIVRKDSGIEQVSDLKGKVVSYPSPTALAAAIMPQRFLQDHGVDVMHDIDNRYVGSQESSILNVLLGEAAAGATWPPPWRLFQRDRPQDAEQLKVIWETAPLLNNSLMVRDDIDAKLAQRLQSLSVNLNQTLEGKKILSQMATARFSPADNQSYDQVRDFIRQFEAEIRPVEPAP